MQVPMKTEPGQALARGWQHRAHLHMTAAAVGAQLQVLTLLRKLSQCPSFSAHYDDVLEEVVPSSYRRAL